MCSENICVCVLRICACFLRICVHLAGRLEDSDPGAGIKKSILGRGTGDFGASEVDITLD